MKQFYKQLKDIITTNEVVMATIVSAPEDKQDLLGQACLWENNNIATETNNTDLQKVWETVNPYVPSMGQPQLMNVNDYQVYSEKLLPQPHLIICGGGHVSLPVAELAKKLEFIVSVIDDRCDFANETRFSTADHVYCENFKTALAKVPDSTANYFVIVTRGHQFDEVCLEAVIERPNAYIGMIGSKTKVHIVKEKIEKRGINRELLDNIHSPIGLDIGGETPEEVGISIIAEIIAVKNQKTSGSSIPADVMAELAKEDDVPKVLATVVKRQGSAPREAGAKMVIRADNKFVGTIGGGCVEGEVKEKALIALETGKPMSVGVAMSPKAGGEEGMICGGQVEVFIQPLNLKTV